MPGGGFPLRFLGEREIVFSQGKILGHAGAGGSPSGSRKWRREGVTGRNWRVVPGSLASLQTELSGESLAPTHPVFTSSYRRFVTGSHHLEGGGTLRRPGPIRGSESGVEAGGQRGCFFCNPESCLESCRAGSAGTSCASGHGALHRQAWGQRGGGGTGAPVADLVFDLVRAGGGDAGGESGCEGHVPEEWADGHYSGDLAGADCGEIGSGGQGF